MSEYSLFRIFEEAKLIKAKQELSTQIIPILGNILDTTHLQRIFQENDVDTIYHAAAYKHVPLVQDHHNISKSLENNFIGTYRVANQATKSNVKSFVLISTDKAVRPTNIMGGSKEWLRWPYKSLIKKILTSIFPWCVLEMLLILQAL